MSAQQGQKFDIEKNGDSIRYRQYTAGGTALWNYYPVSNIKCIEPVAQIGFGARNPSTNQRLHRTVQNDLLRITISFLDDTKPLSFDIQNVMNQGTWTPNVAGMAIALLDINGWIVNSSSSGSAASLANIEALLNTIQSDLTTYNTGSVSTAVLTPGLPYTTSGTENYVTIRVIAGTVVINGSTVPVGDYSFKCGSNETLDSMTISNGVGGSIIVLSQQK